MNHDIFISYSSKQKSIADGVCHYLEENGFKCWMAPRDIPVGSEYGDLIEEAIKTCKAVVLVFSEAASISKWVKGEINVAFSEDKPILPFRVDETEIKGGFRVMLNQMHWIDAFPHYSDRLPDLLNSVSGFLGRQPHKVVSGEKVRLETGHKTKEEVERQRALETVLDVDEFGCVFCTDKNIQGKLLIPSTIKGKRVRGIKKLGFNSCYGLTEVEIPDTVTRIGKSAFGMCSDLANIVIPHSVTIIETASFHSCIRLKRVVIPSSVIEIGSFAFSMCNDLTSIVIPNSVMKIGENAFFQCASLKSAKLPRRFADHSLGFPPFTKIEYY